MHRKSHPIPWGYIFTGLTLLALTLALLASISLLAQPEYAGASMSYLQPAMTAIHKLAS